MIKIFLKKLLIKQILKNKIVLEIGPGYGFLTDNILEKKTKKNYILIEKDNNLKKILKKNIKIIKK